MSVRMLLVLASVLSAGCATATRGGPARQVATVRVQNESFDRVTVRVSRNNRTSERLGAIDPQSAVVFTLAVRAGETYSFVLVPFGHEQDAWMIPEVLLEAGDTVRIMPVTYLPSTSVMVRHRGE